MIVATNRLSEKSGFGEIRQTVNELKGGKKNVKMTIFGTFRS